MAMLTYSGSATGTGTVTLVTPATNSNQTLTLPDNTGTLVSTGSTASVTPAMTQVGALPSMVRLNTANGYGSTNTKIWRFTNTVTNQGSDITYTDSVTLGASFTINTNGVYSASISIGLSTSDYIGISLNTTQPTTSIAGLSNPSEMFCIGNASSVGNASATMYLPSGSVVRPHGTGTGSGGTAANQQFTITRVA